VTAARSSVLGAFTAGKGYSADADYSPRAWLIHKAGITRAAAVSYTAWAKRAVAPEGLCPWCRFHHLIAIHRWGWTLVVNPDGTTTVWNKTRVLHSHSPPARAG
jgi:hypothetical protein